MQNDRHDRDNSNKNIDQEILDEIDQELTYESSSSEGEDAEAVRQAWVSQEIPFQEITFVDSTSTSYWLVQFRWLIGEQ